MSRSRYIYVGPAFLARALSDSSVQKFRGRVLRHEITRALRFYVNRTCAHQFPPGWPERKEWTDDFDVKDVEWLGEKPEGV